MMDSLLKRIEKNRKAHTRWLAMVLCLSMLVSLGTFAGLHKSAQAKVYTKEVLDCPYTHEGAEPVAHVHNDDCYEGETLVCTLPELEAHTHTEECFAEQRRLTCGLEENPGHQHGEGCYVAREVNICGLEENPGHEHNGTCYNESGVLICGMEAGEGAHVHTDACFTTEWDLVCQIPEGEGAHTHTDECYTTERVLICDKPELNIHVHDAGCFRTEEISVDEPEETTEPEQTNEPEQTAEPENPEQTVPEMPVSDPAADLETASDWERDFDDLELSGNWAQDLVLVAATQQGHGESLNNFEAILNDAGDAWVLNGYTRYGAWYGAPYAEEWSAMFVSFCLRYAGIPTENVPNNPTAALMAESFSMGELFAGRGYVPAVGDLIFFDTVHDDITSIDHMGIVYHVDAEDGTINTVEGDRTGAVATFGYTLDDEEIIGYGILPQNPDYALTEEENTGDETDGLIVMTEDTQKNEDTTDTNEATVPAVPMPAQSWERTAGGIKVTVEAPEGAFPENTKIAVTPVNGNSLKDTVSDAVNGEVLEVQAVDITFFDVSGHEIEPAVPIRVVMTPAATQHAEEKANVVHVDIAQQTAELIEQAEGTDTDNSEVVFDADAFTIYAIVYTYDVHFEYEVDGKTYTPASSMPGAKDLSLADVVRGLGIVEEQVIDTFVSKIATVASTDETVVTVGNDGTIRVLKDGEAQIVITMQDGAEFKIDVVAEGETSTTADNAVISTVGELYLPENAVAKAEIVDGEDAVAALQQETGEETEYTVFDISLDNVEAEKYEGFSVTLELPESVIGKDFHLFHVHDRNVEELDFTADSVVVDGEMELVRTLSFVTPNFSEFVLSYTVDFEYEGYTYSMQGESEMLLTDLLFLLNVNVTDDEILSASFSDPCLLRVEKLAEDLHTQRDVYPEDDSDEPMVAAVEALEDDQEPEIVPEIQQVFFPAGSWLLTSLQPFYTTESLTVELADKKIVVTVTDAQNDDGTWHLDDEGVTSSFTVSTQSQTDDISHSASLDLDFAFAITQGTLNEMKQQARSGYPVTITYDVSDALGDKANAVNVSGGSLMVGRRKVGTYSVIDGKLTMTITATDWLQGRTSLTGTFGFSIKMDETGTKNDDEWTFEFPGAGDIDVTFKKKTQERQKTVWSEKNADGSYTLHYSAKITVNQKLDTLAFDDIYTGLQSLNADSVKINGNPVDVTDSQNGFSISSDDFKSAIGSSDGIPADTYEISYTTTVSAEALQKENPKQEGDETGSTEKNEAFWTVDGTRDDKPTTKEIEIPYEYPPEDVPDFGKTSTPASGTTLTNAGEEIEYIIKVGDENHSLKDLHVVDSMTDLQTLNDSKVYITYGSPDGTRTEMPADAIKWVNDDNYSSGFSQVFDYTFTTEQNGPAYIIYKTTTITQEKATEKGIYGNQAVGNNANLINTNDWSSTTHSIPLKEQEKVAVTKTASVSDPGENGNWQPGSTVTYIITIGTKDGDTPTNLNNLHVWDNMTDLQNIDPTSVTLTVTHADSSTETVSSVVKDGETVPISQAVSTDATDNNHSKNDVTAFDFYLPENVGSGQLVITYTTTIISADEAKAAGIYGNVNIRNVGNGGNGSDGTGGTGEFPEEPRVDVSKTVNEKKEETLNSIESEEDRTVHYSLVFDGTREGKSLDSMLISDEMTDIQKLVLDANGDADITIIVENRPAEDIKDASGAVLLSVTDWENGTHSFKMPKASGQWNQDGYCWQYFDDDSYSAASFVRVFYYTLPTGLGTNKITVTFDAVMISQDEANEAGIVGTKDAYNKVMADNKQDQVVTHVPYDEEVTHKPKIVKTFNDWDEANNRLYWKLSVGKQPDSAYPLTGVTVAESKGSANLLVDGYKEGEASNYDDSHDYYQSTQIDWKEGYSNPSVSGDALSFSLFDVAHATVTTASGVVLQPGVDYTIDKSKASFYFPQLDEDIEIVFAVDSPTLSNGKKVNIASGYHMYNVATVTTEEGRGDSDDADARYERTDIYVNKTATYDKIARTITYTVLLNPDAAELVPDKTQILFTDTLEEGVKLLNWASGEENNPTIYLGIYGKQGGNINMNYCLLAENDRTVSVIQSGNVIQEINLGGKNINGGVEGHDQAGYAGLSQLCYQIQYKVSVEDDWPNITSSETGYKDFSNHAEFKVGDETYEGETTTRVTTDEYIKKYDTTREDTQGYVIAENDEGEEERSWSITYSVDINPNREQLNSVDNPLLQVTDIISTKVELDTDSVKLVKVSTDGTEEDITESLDISYNDNTRLLSISNIPDKEYVKLTFAVESRSQGTDTFTNTATVIGGGSHSSSVTDEHSIATSYASLGGNEVVISLRKIDENNITKRLPGAEFKLYEAKWACEALDSEQGKALLERLMTDWIESNYFNKAGKDYSYIYENFKITEYVEISDNDKVKDSQHGQGKVYITGDTGEITWDEILSDMKVYAWEEVAAPEGYTGILNDKHWFIVYPEYDAEDGTYNTQNYPWGTGDYSYIAQCIAWALDNATSMANTREDGSDIVVASMGDGTVWTATNVQEEKTSIGATKKWQGDMDNLFDTRPENGIKVQLWRMHQDGTEKETIGNPVPINVDPETGIWPTYYWYNLDKYYAVAGEDGSTEREEWRYYVVEDQVPEYTTTYENNDGISIGEITITNKLIPTNTEITVKKVFDPDGDHKPSQIIVELWKINTPVGGEPEEAQFTGQTAALTANNNWEYTFKGLDTRSENGYLTYTAIERQTTELEGFGYTTTYSDNGEGISDGEITITNSLPGSLEVEKTIVGLERELTDEEKANIAFVVTGPKDFRQTFTYAEMTDGKKTFEKLVPGEYTVTETITTIEGYTQKSTTYIVDEGETEEGNSGKTTVVGGTKASIAFTNTYEKAVGALKLAKNVTVNGSAVAAARTKRADGEYTFTIVGPGEGTTEIAKVTIKVEDGVATKYKIDDAETFANLPDDKFVVISELEPGNYTVTEGTPENGTAISKINGEDSMDYFTTVTVTAGEAAPEATVTFTNNIVPMTTVEGTKTWIVAGDVPKDYPTLTLTRKSAKENSSTETVTVADGQPMWSSVEGKSNIKKYAFSDLDQYDSEGYLYTYSVSEASFKDGDVTYIVTKSDDGTYTVKVGETEVKTFTVTQDGNDITNTEKKDFEFSKIWKQLNGSSEAWPNGKSITVTLNAKAGTEEKALDDVELTFDKNVNSEWTIPDGWTKVENADRSVTFKTDGLTARNDKGEELTYYVVEKQIDGYTATYVNEHGGTSGAFDKGTITNTPMSGYELPQTGGIGTTLFTALGSLMTATAGAILTMKSYRRRKENA